MWNTSWRLLASVYSQSVLIVFFLTSAATGASDSLDWYSASDVQSIGAQGVQSIGTQGAQSIGAQGAQSSATEEDPECRDAKEYAGYCKEYRKNKFCKKYEYGMRKYCALTCGFCKCKAKVDIAFLVDGSGSIEKQGKGNFQKCLDFVKGAVNATVVSPQYAHVAVAVFSSQIKLIFGLDQYYDQKNISAAIDKIVYPKGGTRTGMALHFVKEEVFDKGGRTDAPRILIVMTDGKSYGQPAISEPAKALKDSGVSIFAIGIGDSAEQGELAEISSDPDEVYLQETTFDELPAVYSEIRDELCRVRNSTASAILMSQADLGDLGGFDEYGVVKSDVPQAHKDRNRHHHENKDHHVYRHDHNVGHHDNRHHNDDTHHDGNRQHLDL